MNPEPESSSNSILNLDEKRQVIYAALLRFNPEAMELRQRGLERVVLNGLLGSTEETTYKVDRIQKNLQKRPQAPELRDDLIRGTLRQLVTDGKARRFEHKSSKSYCITDKGAAEINHALEQAADIFEPVIRDMLKHTDALMSMEVAAPLCRAFIMECFARFGRLIARSVMGRLDPSDLAKSSEVDLAFQTAVSGKNLSLEMRESLYHRCVQFIRSSEPQDERLKLRLTQGFFLAELLCIEGTPFDPLSRQAFKGSVFYLDTNVIFIGLLATKRQADLFGEMLRLATRLGIELRVTRATINEARRVVANRRHDLENYLDKVPAELNELTHDDFLSTYNYLESLDPNLTPKQFFDRFERLADILQQEWKIQLDDRTEDEILGDSNFEKEAALIQEEAKATRPSAKSDQVLRHDLAQFAVIKEERKRNPKTWLLTADRSLIRAAARLLPTKTVLTAAAGAGGGVRALFGGGSASQETNMPYCFSLAGFLQSISPFTASAGEESSLADIFSSLVTDYLSLHENLFDMREMNLIMEWHEDVMITPPEQLVPALDYVKSKVLQGRQYSVADLPKVALELKKFLSKSVEERHQALETEAERRAAEIRREQQARADLEKELEREKELRSIDAVEQKNREGVT
jgi:hypothetical protein